MSKRKKVVIIIILLLILLIKIIPMLVLKIMDMSEKEILKAEKHYGNEYDDIKKTSYNIIDLINRLAANSTNTIKDEEYNIVFEDDLPYTNEKKYNFKVNLNNIEKDSTYKIILNDKEQELKEGQNKITCKLNEGENNLNIVLEKDDMEFYSLNKKMFYIEEYEKQFLDELNENAVSAHFYNGIDDIRSVQLLKYLGIKIVRDDIAWKDIEKSDGQYNFEKVDSWVNLLTENNIEIIGILDKPGKLLGDDQLISSEEELEKYVKFAIEVAKRYPQIKKYEVMNESNHTNKYVKKELMYFYAKAVNRVIEEFNKIDPEIQVISGATAGIVNDSKTQISSDTFIKNIIENNEDARYVSLHQYDDTKNAGWVNIMLNSHLDVVRNLGGFMNTYITEYGVSTYKNGYSELQQATRIIRHAMLFKQKDINLNTIYNSRNIGNVSTAIEHNYGIFNYDYTPKSSYYMLKNFYENINGAEYIGTVNLANGIEAHVYNKNGKPKIIAWAKNVDNSIEIDYKDYIAKDIYGNEIANVDNKLPVTMSTVYLDNIGREYFYRAISNTAIGKYGQFEEKFAKEIEQITGFQENINSLKQKATDIGSHSENDEITENIAKQLMKDHYQLGTTLIDAYKNGNLNIEDVGLSSMLDALDDIGNSYEDLVTITAKTRNENLEDTNIKIEASENLVTNSKDLTNSYPNKILEFSKKHYEKAKYISELEEANEIKTGLIVSNDLHSVFLAEWASNFAKIYVDKYIEEHPVEIVYSETELTNNNVIATLETTADIEVTNNSNSRQHVFEENNSFVFEYRIKGYEFTKTATVNNIDKQKPEVTGIENDRLYREKITPKVTDENLEKIELYKNEELIQGYQSGKTISEEGTYKLVAIDRAKNETDIDFYIYKEPAKVEYSITELTNENVTVTLKSDLGLKVNNNSGKDTYIFQNNGSFTFNYTIKGLTMTKKVSVNYIDKEPPVITGVKQNEIYIDKASFSVVDKNLKEVKIILNEEEISYKDDMILDEEGFYEVIATDKAGNKTVVNFIVFVNKIEEYQIRGQNIKNIENNTKKSQFKQKLNLPVSYEIFRDGKTLNDDSIIATGDILRTASGTEYTLIVAGDINKDGNVDIRDMVKLRKYLLDGNNLDKIQLLAADCNIDEKEITIRDFVRMRIIILAKE